MKYLWISFCTACLFYGFSCQRNIYSQNDNEPDMNFRGMEGTWVYTTSGEGHGFVLRAFRNADGDLVFKYVKQFYDSEPAFVGYSVKNNQVEIDFELIPNVHTFKSHGQLKLILTKDGEKLKGQLLRSGKKPENITLKKHHEYMNIEPFVGTWLHHINIVGKKRTHIIRGFIDQTGRLTFTFLKQYYSHEPVFTECVLDRKNNLEIRFKLTNYITGYESKHKVKYVLKPKDGTLFGQLHESWKEPADVQLFCESQMQSEINHSLKKLISVLNGESGYDND